MKSEKIFTSLDCVQCIWFQLYIFCDTTEMEKRKKTCLICMIGCLLFMNKTLWCVYVCVCVYCLQAGVNWCIFFFCLNEKPFLLNCQSQTCVPLNKEREAERKMLTCHYNAAWKERKEAVKGEEHEREGTGGTEGQTITTIRPPFKQLSIRAVWYLNETTSLCRRLLGKSALTIHKTGTHFSSPAEDLLFLPVPVQSFHSKWIHFVQISSIMLNMF